MASYNKVMLIGNITRDPEIRYTPKGTAVTDVGLAVNRIYTVEGEKREETTFVDITFWGRQAEVVGEYCKKGNPLFVEGRLQMDSWEDKQSGQKRSRLKIVAEGMQLLGGRGGGGGGGRGPDSDDSDETSSRPPSREASSGSPSRSVQEPEEDDIPF